VQSLQHIHCTVSNCYYWDSGNVCLAKEILVTSDSVGAKYPDSLDASNMMEVAQEIGSMSAPSCMATCCKTFVDKGEAQKAAQKAQVQKISRPACEMPA
jgi:hypothetical protein